MSAFGDGARLQRLARELAIKVGDIYVDVGEATDGLSGLGPACDDARPFWYAKSTWTEVMPKCRTAAENIASRAAEGIENIRAYLPDEEAARISDELHKIITDTDKLKKCMFVPDSSEEWAEKVYGKPRRSKTAQPILSD